MRNTEPFQYGFVLGERGRCALDAPAPIGCSKWRRSRWRAWPKTVRATTVFAGGQYRRRTIPAESAGVHGPSMSTFTPTEKKLTIGIDCNVINR